MYEQLTVIQGSKEGLINARAILCLVSNLPWLTAEWRRVYKPICIMYGLSLRKADLIAAVIRKCAGRRSQPTMTSTFSFYFKIYEV